MDKTVVKIIRTEADLKEADMYWADKTPTERLAALEEMRRQVFPNETKTDKTIFGRYLGKQE
jgi:hypothetical protein